MARHKSRKRSLAQAPGVAIVICAGVIFAPGTADAQAICDHQVPGGDVAALISAIHAANSNADPTTICLAAAATYTVDTAIASNHGDNAFPVISSPVRIEGHNATIVRSPIGDTMRFFYVDGPGGQASSLSLHDLYLKGGRNPSPSQSSAASGGAILAQSADLTLERVRLIDNECGPSNCSGGAVSTPGGGMLAVSECYFADNRSTYQGGALYSNGGPGALTIVDSVFERNVSEMGGAMAVHAAHLAVPMRIEDSHFAYNRAEHVAPAHIAKGGGLYIQWSENVEIRRTTIANNASSGSGGGLYISNSGVLAEELYIADNHAENGTGGGLWAATSNLDIEACTVAGNVSERGGGGISVGSSTLNEVAFTLANSTVSHNRSNEPGGGVVIGQVDTTIRNTSIVANQADSVDALYMGPTGTNLELRVANSVIAGDSPDSCYVPYTQEFNFVSEGYNLYTHPSCAAFFDAASDQAIADPKLAQLSWNGGYAPTRLPETGSPLIDAADNAVCQAAPINAVDQRGFLRPVGAACDVGSVEHQGLAETLHFRARPGGAATGSLGDSFSASFGHPNPDQGLQLLVADHGNANRQFGFTPDGHSFGLTAQHLTTTMGTSLSISWVDLDGDGDLDAYVANLGHDQLVRNDGGTYQPWTAPALTTPTSHSVSGSFADVNSDGYLDLLVAHTANGDETLFLNHGDQGLVVSGGSGLAGHGGNSVVGAFADTDNDGDLDLLVTNHVQQANAYFINDGTGVFTRVYDRGLSNEQDDSFGAAWADFDRDGDLDLAVANYGRNRVYVNDGQGYFSQADLGHATSVSVVSRQVAWADLNNDGRLDLLFANAGVNHIYLQQVDGSLILLQNEAIATDSGDSRMLSLADIDGDGRLDVYFANSGNQANQLYQNVSPAGRSLVLELIGSSSHRSSIGARIYVRSQSDGQWFTQMQEVHGRSDIAEVGRQHFGLGQASQVAHLRIVWPSGRSREYDNVDLPAEGPLRLRVVEPGAPTSVDGTSEPWASSRDSFAATWADYDNDGDVDLFVANHSSPNQLFRNVDGQLQELSASPVAQASAISLSANWIDYDGDHDLDLFVCNFGSNELYENQGQGQLTSVPSSPIVQSTRNCAASSWFDYDGDGWLDLMIANTSNHDNQIFHNDGFGQFTEVLTGAIVNDGGNSASVAIADYDADGRPDVYVGNHVGQANFLYRNLGNGNFSAITQGPLVTDTEHSFGAAWADMDNDGDFDLAVANAGLNAVYRNLGSGNFERLLADPTVTDHADSRQVLWLDVDGDGDQDLLVANLGRNALYYNQGGSFERETMGAFVQRDEPSRMISAGDFDNDGRLDIYVSQSNATANRMYRNILEHDYFARVILRGRTDNRWGVGARVEVEANLQGQAHVQVSQVSGMTNLWPTTPLYFGLGDRLLTGVPELTRLEIDWPSGRHTVRGGIDYNPISIYEPPS